MNRNEWTTEADNWAAEKTLPPIAMAKECPGRAYIGAIVNAIADRVDSLGGSYPPSTRTARRAVQDLVAAWATPEALPVGLAIAAGWTDSHIGMAVSAGLLRHPCRLCEIPGSEVHPPRVEGREVSPILACGQHRDRVYSETLGLAQKDWMRVSPMPVLGDVGQDAGAVRDAGCMSLDSRHSTLGVRPTMEDENDPQCRWTVSLGVGGYMMPVRRISCPAGRRSKRRVRGAGSWPTREEAEAAGRAAWEQAVAERVEEIRVARGGDLGWGLRVTPRDEPIMMRMPYRGSAPAE